MSEVDMVFSALRSGPVPVLDPSGLKPRTRLDLETSKTQENQTRTDKNWSKLVHIGSYQLQNQCSETWLDCPRSVVVVRGNPGVSQLYPYP